MAAPKDKVVHPRNTTESSISYLLWAVEGICSTRETLSISSNEIFQMSLPRPCLATESISAGHEGVQVVGILTDYRHGAERHKNTLSKLVSLGDRWIGSHKNTHHCHTHHIVIHAKLSSRPIESSCDSEHECYDREEPKCYTNNTDRSRPISGYHSTLVL